MEKRGKSKKGRQNKIRSRNESMENEKKIKKESRPKIKIPIYDDSNKTEAEIIEDYINHNKEDLNSGKINLQTYISKNDIDNEQIFIYLTDVLKKDAKQFCRIYEDQFFKLTLDQRDQLLIKLQDIKDIVMPEYITRNTLKEIGIEKTFINILKGLKNISPKDLSIENIKKVFWKIMFISTKKLI